MKWYKCSIVGEHFPGALIDEIKPIGFYTTKFVEAENGELAEALALSNLRDDESLKLPAGVSLSREAKVYFEEVVEVSTENVPETDSGFSFYVMGT